MPYISNTIKTSVKKRKILPAWCLLPILLWGLATIVSLLFFTLSNIKPTITGPIFVCSFFSIIPVTIISLLITRPYRGDSAFYEEDVDFKIENGFLYANNIRITGIRFDRVQNEISINNTVVTSAKVKGHTITSSSSTFIGVVQFPYTDVFYRFLVDNGVEVKE